MSIRSRKPIPNRKNTDPVPNRYRTGGFRYRYRYPHLEVFGFGIIGIGTRSVWYRYFKVKYQYHTRTEPISYRMLSVSVLVGTDTVPSSSLSTTKVPICAT